LARLGVCLTHTTTKGTVTQNYRWGSGGENEKNRGQKAKSHQNKTNKQENWEN